MDKTSFIKEWWENGDTVTLITRPRRFGKTLAMHMLDEFFSVKHSGRKVLFEGLDIWKEEKYRKLQGTYPVIFLSFASVKAAGCQETLAELKRLIAREYRRYAFLLESGCFLQTDREQFELTMSGKADITDFGTSLNQLSEYLYNYYGRKVILILDEYDTPMQEAYVNGYWKELTQFMRTLFNSSFKTNSFLERGIMTGITRISKESIFSDLNNLTIVTTTSKKYETAFGFTQEEVFQGLAEFELQDKMDEVSRWYDGFRFGGCEHIYNPWSITNYLKNREFRNYWANSGSNKLAGSLIHKSDINTKLIMEELLQGRSFRTSIDEETVFSDLDTKKTAVFSLLLAGGYFKVLQVVRSRRGKEEYELALTNMETRFIFDEMVTGWFSNNRLDYNDFSDALLSGDTEYMNGYINAIVAETFSYFDTGQQPSEFKQPENFYHGFVLGLIADLRGIYMVTSNRESGKKEYET